MRCGPLWQLISTFFIEREWKIAAQQEYGIMQETPSHFRYRLAAGGEVGEPRRVEILHPLCSQSQRFGSLPALASSRVQYAYRSVEKGWWLVY